MFDLRSSIVFSCSVFLINKHIKRPLERDEMQLNFHNMWMGLACVFHFAHILAFTAHRCRKGWSLEMEMDVQLWE